MKNRPITSRSGNENGTALFHLAEARLEERLEKLLMDAKMSGFVIAVHSESVEPLAMGNHRMVGHVRPELMRQEDGTAV